MIAFNFGHRTNIAANTTTYLPGTGGTNQAAEITLLIPCDGSLKNLSWDCQANGLTGAGNEFRIKVGDLHTTPTSPAPALTDALVVSIDGKTNGTELLNFPVVAGQRIGVQVRTVAGGTNISRLRVSFELDVLSTNPWQAAGTNLYYDQGNVGLGIANPQATLEVNGTVQLGGVATNPGISINSNGDVGVGTANPAAKLHVSMGDALFEKDVQIGATGSLNSQGPIVAVGGLQIPTDAISGHVLTSDAAGEATWQPLPSGGSGIGGTGTAGALPKFTDPLTLADSAIFESNGKVGIGIKVPFESLHVFGNSFFEGLLRIAGATKPLKLQVGGGNAYFEDNVGIGTSDPIGKLQVSGGNALFGGNVGIGTTNPVGKLQVSGGNTIFDGNVGIGTGSSGAQGAHLHVTSSVGGIQLKLTDARPNGGTLNLLAGANFGGISVEGPNPLFLSNNNQTRMMIDPNGAVGIGTTNPQATLDVNGFSRLKGVSVEGDLIIPTTGSIDAQGPIRATGSLIGGDASFDKVGIGTTNPSDKLHVTGGNAVFDGSVGIGVINPGKKIDVVESEGNVLRLQRTNFPARQWDINIKTSGSFIIGDNTAKIDRFTIDTNGNVGIGVMNPLADIGNSSIQHGLETRGWILARGNGDNTWGDGAARVGVARPGSQPNEAWWVSANPDGNFAIHQGGVGDRMTIDTNGDIFCARGQWSGSSRRLKKKIKPIKDALEKIKKLQGVTFKWKSDGKQSIGLIAEDVGGIIPEAVEYEENHQDAKGLDYNRLVAVLIEAVKEQQGQIEELKETVKLLLGDKGKAVGLA